MSISKRKIGHYYLKLHDKENKDICYPNSTIINLLNFLNDVEKIDKLKSMPTQHKFYFLNPISIKPHIANLTFTNAKTYHSPDLISEQTRLQYSKSGIIAWEDKNVFLINKK